MKYELVFHPDALKEWNKLSKNIKEQFKKVLVRRLDNPHIPAAHLKGELKSCYKIKLLKAGYRLVYQVLDDQLLIVVVTVGKRENNLVYEIAKRRHHRGK